MPRKSDKLAFTRRDARRIADVVRRVEAGDRGSSPLEFGFRPVMDSESPLRVGKVPFAWDIGTCATVYVWKRTGTGENCLPAEPDPPETVEGVVNLSHNVPAGSWVVVGQASDGTWCLIESGMQVESPDEQPTCQQTIGGEDITRWAGWDGTKVQLLGHDENGCLKWFDSEECETSPGAP